MYTPPVYCGKVSRVAKKSHCRASCVLSESGKETYCIQIVVVLSESDSGVVL